MLFIYSLCLFILCHKGRNNTHSQIKEKFVGCRYTSIRAVAPHLCQSLGCLSHSLYQHCSQDSFFYRLMMAKGFPCGSAGEESACNVGDLGLIPGLGRSPGEGKGYPLQYSGLENSMDRIIHGVAKSWT